MRGWRLLALSSILVVALFGVLLMGMDDPGSGETLTFYCAAVMRKPVTELIRMYEEEHGVTVTVQYGGSGTLLSNLRVAKEGDLYLAADSSYTDLAIETGLIDEATPVGYLRPVIAVEKGNPESINGIDDLIREDVRVALASPDAASIGKQTQILLESLGRWDAVEEAARVFKPTVNDVANDVLIGTVDAAIVWDATVNQYEGLEAVAIDGAESFAKTITIGVLRYSDSPERARDFIGFMTAGDKGQRVIERSGIAVQR